MVAIVTHDVASLLHYLADTCTGSSYMTVYDNARLRLAMPDALRLRLVESMDSGARLDRYWLRLTPEGRFAVEEMLAVGSLIVRER